MLPFSEKSVFDDKIQHKEENTFGNQKAKVISSDVPAERIRKVLALRSIG